MKCVLFEFTELACCDHCRKNSQFANACFHIFYNNRNLYLAWTHKVFYCLRNPNRVWRHECLWRVFRLFVFSQLWWVRKYFEGYVSWFPVSSTSCLLRLLQKKFHNLVTRVFIFSATIAIFIPGWTYLRMKKNSYC